MRILIVALLLSLGWTLLAYVTEPEGSTTTHPSSLGLAVVGIGTLSAYEWIRRRDARKVKSPSYKQAFDAVAERYAGAQAEAAAEAARDEAEHAA